MATEMQARKLPRYAEGSVPRCVECNSEMTFYRRFWRCPSCEQRKTQGSMPVVCAGPARWLCTIYDVHICVIAAELDAAE